MSGQIPYLSEFDYKLAHSCLTKLYYKKHNYPVSQTPTPYDRCLTDATFMVYALALQRFTPQLVLCGQDLTAGFQQTLTYLDQPQITLWEPVLIANHKIARPFLLQKTAELYHLIYVSTKSSKSFRNRRNGHIQSEWMSAFISLAFQYLVLAELFPSVTIKCQMLLPDRDFVAPVDHLHRGFSIQRETRSEILSRFSGIRLIAKDEPHLADFLRLEDVTTEVTEVRESIKDNVHDILQMLRTGLTKPIVPIDIHCKNCEFKTGQPHDGFRECWGELADVENHIFNFYHGTRLTKDNKTIVRHLIESKQASMFDVPPEALEDNFHGKRQRIQLDYTARNQEWVSPDLAPLLDKCTYPLHFLDFETARLAVPPLQGLSPYTIVAFQWSCHTIPAPDAPPLHRSWLGLHRDFPNWEFAQTLSQHLGLGGTVFTWGMHEQTILKEIHHQMTILHHPDHQTREWLTRRLPLVDLHALTLKYYFHPRMAGRTSLKTVFPAIWQTNPYLHTIPWLQEYVKVEGGVVQNPYHALDRGQFTDRELVIKEGMEAALAYQEINFGTEQGNPLWGKLLEQYCRLDTIGMVVVWLHWQKLLSPSGTDERR